MSALHLISLPASAKTRKSAKQPRLSMEALDSSDDSKGTYSSELLGKRLHASDFGSKKVQILDQQDDLNLDDNESSEKREKRLLQNRKSAKKCRQKKKALFNVLKNDVSELSEENKVLKEKINDITMMLYTKIEENTALQKKLEQVSISQAFMMTNLMHLNQPQSSQSMHSPTLSGSAPNLNHLLLQILQNNIGGLPNSSNSNQLASSTLEKPKSQIPKVQSRPGSSQDPATSPLLTSLLRQENLGTAQSGFYGLPRKASVTSLSNNMKEESNGVAVGSYQQDMLTLLKQLCQKKSSEDWQPNSHSHSDSQKTCVSHQSTRRCSD